MTCLLTTGQMYQADRAAMAAGISGPALMEAAGWQVARAIRRRFRPRPVLVLCGPGNNGGDGFVVARLLQSWGWPVRLALLGHLADLRGDAARMARAWAGGILPVTSDFSDLFHRNPLVVDALFGAGLSRPLGGAARAVLEEVGRRGLPLVAIDVPSGVDGNSGQVLGYAPQAELTVTFFRPKPGHVLLPGRLLCGELVVADIGIPVSVLEEIKPSLWVNGPDLWTLPRPGIAGHKYQRGHVLVAGGGEMTGAARLASQAARRAGAGLCTIAAPTASLPIYRTGDAGTIVADQAHWAEFMQDHRKNVAVIGPGLGVGAAARGLALSALAAGKICVLDADALTSFHDPNDRSALFAAFGQAVLTPHDGEYARLFAHQGDRLSRALLAARESGAVILLKGPDTVVAAPDGRAAVSIDAPPTLATGGSGDVLAGIIAGLLAQGMTPFDAACAGVWLHGRAAAAGGDTLLAEDLPSLLECAWADTNHKD